MTPLERAARALVNNYPLDGGESPLSWQEVLPVVSAVLQAIREPSLSQADFGANVISQVASLGDCAGPAELEEFWGSATDAWQRMIDAALEEG